MPDSLPSHFRALRISSALQDRTIGHHAPNSQHKWFALFLESGRVVAQSKNTDYEIVGPAVFWGPLDGDTRLRVSAGSVGSQIMLGDRILSEAVGLVAEAAELQLFVQRPILASLRDSVERQQLEALFERLVVEGNTSQFGTEIAVSAYIRLVLVLLWRSLDTEVAENVTLGPQRALLNRFRQLVETHFRARWKVQQYADALGITYDRLHDLCTRALGKSPSLLIRERSTHEAQMLLSRTSFSSEQISAMLGFSASAQFNHFFKSMTGDPPRRYRQNYTRDKAANTQDTHVSFSDWP